MRQLRVDIIKTLSIKLVLLFLLWHWCIAPIKHHKVKPQEMAAQLFHQSVTGESNTHGRL